MRRHDWPERLHEVIDKAKKETFKWGTHDCVLFTCDCVLAMTGKDHIENSREKYTSERGARKALKEIENVKGLGELADKFWGERIKLSSAGRGDVVILMNNKREVFGIVIGKHAVFLSPKGIEMRSLDTCKHAWKVN